MTDDVALQAEYSTLLRDMNLRENAKPVEFVCKDLLQGLKSEGLDPFKDPNNQWISQTNNPCCTIL